VLATDNFPSSAGNDCVTVIQDKMKARIAFLLCFLAGLFAFSGCGSGPSLDSLQRDGGMFERGDYPEARE
jgi:hypothetical protein